METNAMGKLTKLQRTIREFLENVELDRAGDLDAQAVKIEELVDEIVQSNLPDFDDFLRVTNGDEVREFLRQNELADKDDVAAEVEKYLGDDFMKKEDMEEALKECRVADLDDLADVQKVVDERTQVMRRGFFGRVKWLLTGR